MSRKRHANAVLRAARLVWTRRGDQTLAAGWLGAVRDAPQLGQFRQAASTAWRHWAHARRTAPPQLAQNAWPLRAGVPQLGQGIASGSRRMK